MLGVGRTAAAPRFATGRAAAGGGGLGPRGGPGGVFERGGGRFGGERRSGGADLSAVLGVTR